FLGGRRMINTDGAADYFAAVAAGTPVRDRLFDYHDGDLRVLYVTRRLAALAIDRREYRGLFGNDVTREFRSEVEALREANLITVAPRVICPTPRGMFYADSIAALLARRQVQARRAEPGDWGLPLVDLNTNGFGHM